MEAYSSELLAYLGGYFDGEGSICYDKTPPYFALMVRVGSGDKAVLDLFHQHFGGSLISKKPMANTRRQIFQWSLSGNLAQKFLQAIYPFLRSEKAGLARIAQLSTFNKNNKTFKLSPEESKLRFILSTVTSSINNRVTVERPS